MNSLMGLPAPRCPRCPGWDKERSDTPRVLFAHFSTESQLQEELEVALGGSGLVTARVYLLFFCVTFGIAYVPVSDARVLVCMVSHAVCRHFPLLPLRTVAAALLVTPACLRVPRYS